MGQRFAGILGVTALCTTVLRGAIGGLSPEGTLQQAVIYLFAFAAVGWIIGTIAESTVDSSVRTRFAAEMKAAEAAAAAKETI